MGVDARRRAVAYRREALGEGHSERLDLAQDIRRAALRRRQLLERRERHQRHEA